MIVNKKLLLALTFFSSLFVFPTEALAIQNQSDFEQKELSFIRPVVNAYLDPNTTDLSTVYQYAQNNDLSGFYRAVCSGVTALTLDKYSRGQTLSYSHPLVQRMMLNIDQDFNINKLNFWLVGAPAFDCLIASNLIRNQLPLDKKNKILSSIQSLAQEVFRQNTVDSFKADQRNNAGDTKAEEIGIVMAFLNGAARLLPDAGVPGGITPDTRSAWLERVSDLATYAISRCSQDCPFTTAGWLVANHQMKPHPIYTQSLLTSYDEVALIYNQLGESLPGNIFTPTLISAVGNIAQALQNYVGDDFRLHGPFDLIDTAGNITRSARYEEFNYSVVNWDISSHNSSIPINYLDSATQFYTSFGGLYSYVTRGNRIWQYICNPSCYAVETKTLAEKFAGLSLSPPLPTDRFDTLSQYKQPDGNFRTNITKDDRTWGFVCSLSGTCTAGATRTLSEQWNSIVNQYLWPYDPADTFVQYRGVIDWGFDASLQNNAYAIMAILQNNLVNRYQQLQAEQIKRGVDVHSYFPPSYNNGNWSWNPLTAAKNAPLLSPLTDGLYRASTDAKINNHWWLNMLDARNHSMAYLSITSNKLLAPFNSSSPSPTPIPLPGDINHDNKVNIRDYSQLVTDFGKTGSPDFVVADINNDGTVDIFDYNVLVGNFGLPR